MTKKSLSKKIEEKGAKIPNLSPTQALFSNVQEQEQTDNKKEIKSKIDETSSEQAITSTDNEENIINKTEKNISEKAEGDSHMVEAKNILLSFSNKKVEETHKRSTFLVRRDLLKRLDKLASGRHGFKTEFINYAIEKALVEIEKEFKQK
jgi:hypothetical protein